MTFWSQTVAQAGPSSLPAIASVSLLVGDGPTILDAGYRADQDVELALGERTATTTTTMWSYAGVPVGSYHVYGLFTTTTSRNVGALVGVPGWT